MWKFGKLWAGDESSYELAVGAIPQALAYQATGREQIRSDILTIDNGIGIIRIEGGLIPGEAGFMAYFGLTGYGDIRNAVIEAAMHADVKSILLSINSGGGAVDGCADCGSIIAKINAEVKPILTYADGSMGSAAYWLGSQADTILIGPTSVVGSIGVILKHTEMSKAREAAGITDTVIRSGKFKQLANPLEPLTDAAQSELQQMSDDIYDVFLNAVAEGRGMTASAVDSKMGKGREFVGQRAVSAGLADGIATYEGALSAAILLSSVDTKAAPAQNKRSTGANMKKSLTEAQIAALASGAELDASAAQQTAESTAEAAAAATLAAAATAAEGDPAKTAEATAAAAEAANTAAAASAAATTATQAALTAESELVKFLRGELQTAQAARTADAIKIANLEAAAQVTADSMPKLLEIARGAVGKMKVALGGSAEAAAAMSPLEVIAAHAEVSTAFVSKFKVGGAAGTSAAATEQPKPVVKPAGPPNLVVIAARAAGAKSNA